MEVQDRRQPSAQKAILAGWLALALAVLALTAICAYALTAINDVQGRGLTASPYLICSLDDIHQLLTLPQTAASKHQQAALPPKERATEVRILRNLNRNLATYVQIEQQQPGSQRC